jgi:hypothetical protein
VKNKIVAALERHGPPIKDPSKAGLARKSFKDAPVFILLLCDWRARVGMPGDSPRTKEQVAGAYYSSLANAFLYMHLAATSLGLASQWYTATSSRPDAERAIKEIVGIPEELSIYDMMVLGYAAAPKDPKIVRELDEVIHYDSCGESDFRTDEEVKEYARQTKACACHSISQRGSRISARRLRPTMMRTGRRTRVAPLTLVRLATFSAAALFPRR